MQLYASGTRIAGRYEVAGRPLMGGMGIVYRCLDVANHERPVALKTFKPEYLPDRAARDRFLREGTTWIDLGPHPHIVRAYEVVYVGDGREVYIVLELVTGEPWCKDASLRSWLASGRLVPVPTVLLTALQIARGMKHASGTVARLVHRDLKPENILVGADRLNNASMNRVRVTDFGLAKLLDESGRTIEPTVGWPGTAAGPEICSRPERTQLTQGVAGTPGYMAPEQWRNDTLSTATDVYALGCILIEMLTGRPVVLGSWGDFKRAHCEGGARAVAESLPGSVRELVLRCVDLDPEARCGDWAEVEKELAEVYGRVSGEAAPEPETAESVNRAERVAAGWSHSNIGASYLDIGKAEVARGYFERALEAGRAEGERRLEGAALGNLGIAYRQLGDARRAIGYYEQDLEIAREIGNRLGEGRALGNLGTAYGTLGDARRAVNCFERRLVIAREIGDRRGEGTVLGNLGNAYSMLGDMRQAAKLYEQSLAIAQEIGDRAGEGRALGNLGATYYRIGDHQKALAYLKQDFAIAHELGDAVGSAQTALNLAQVLFLLRRGSEALHFAEFAEKTFAQAGLTESAQQAKLLGTALRTVIR